MYSGSVRTLTILLLRGWGLAGVMGVHLELIGGRAHLYTAGGGFITTMERALCLVPLTISHREAVHWIRLVLNIHHGDGCALESSAEWMSDA